MTWRAYAVYRTIDRLGVQGHGKRLPRLPRHTAPYLAARLAVLALPCRASPNPSYCTPRPGPSAGPVLGHPRSHRPMPPRGAPVHPRCGLGHGLVWPRSGKLRGPARPGFAQASPRVASAGGSPPGDVASNGGLRDPRLAVMWPRRLAARIGRWPSRPWPARHSGHG